MSKHQKNYTNILQDINYFAKMFVIKYCVRSNSKTSVIIKTKFRVEFSYIEAKS